jgi:hypothetical protein
MVRGNGGVESRASTPQNTTLLRQLPGPNLTAPDTSWQTPKQDGRFFVDYSGLSERPP